MASDLGQNRYSDFVALETLLRFEIGSTSHSLLSSWRRFHVLKSSHPSFHRTVFFSGHRWLFFLASLWAYVVVASFLCLRVIRSSFRRLGYILGQVLNMRGHILYQLYSHTFYRHPVTLLPCYLVTLLFCYLATL